MDHENRKSVWAATCYPRPFWAWALCLTGLFAVACGQMPPPLEREDFPIPEGAAVATAPVGQFGGVLTMTTGSEPRTYNPLIVEDASSGQVTSLILSSLITFNPVTEEYIPSLAAGWDVHEDRLTYTVHLRRGVRWSDGEPITADDVIFTFDTIFNPAVSTRYSSQFTIAGQPVEYEKVDDFTVRFRTPDLYAPFINDLTFVDILPRHALEESVENGTFMQQWSGETGLTAPHKILSSGPFRLRSMTPGERVVLEANPHYWKVDAAGNRLPYIDRVIFNVVSDDNTAAILLATGQVDVGTVRATDLGWIEDKAQQYDFTIFNRGPDSGISFIWFNLNPGSRNGRPFVPPYKLKWFSDPRFRHAVAHGFDRPGLIRAVYFGLAEMLHSNISPANRKWHNPDTTQYLYDPDESRRLLREMGFELRGNQLFDRDGHRVSFDLIYSHGSARTEAIANTLRENMRDLGIDVRVTPLDFGTMVARIANSYDYETGIIGFTGGGDPSGDKALWRSDGRLHVWHPLQESPATEWEARIDEIMDLQEREFDEARRIELIHEMQQILAEQLPMIYLVTPNAFVGIQNRWNNLRIPPLGSVIWNIDEIWTEVER